MNLEAELNEILMKAVNAITTAVRQDVVRHVTEALANGVWKAPVAAVAQPKKAEAAGAAALVRSLRTKPRDRKGEIQKAARRLSEEKISTLLKAIRTKPGLRSEELQAAAKTLTKDEVRGGLFVLRERKAVTTRGDRRLTCYHAA